MNMLARWLFRRIVGPRIIGFIVYADQSVYPGEILSPVNVEVVFRGR